MKLRTTLLFTVISGYAASSLAGDVQHVDDSVINAQRTALATNTANQGFGPQSPRNIDQVRGDNDVIFNLAPSYQKMNLCNIHFHKNAEHAGGEFTDYAGNGDGHGYHTGYKYAKSLTAAELSAIDYQACSDSHGGLSPGDTVELHYVHTTATVKPGPTLGACLDEATFNPQLRVEAQVFVLVNDDKALSFTELTEVEQRKGYWQAANIPRNMGKPVEYTGSTTGPSYNEAGSPFQVSWSVRPKVAKVNIHTVDEWCQSNIFDEDHAHGVRNLVVNPKLLSKIK